jgi:hypothetical protein
MFNKFKKQIKTTAGERTGRQLYCPVAEGFLTWLADQFWFRNNETFKNLFHRMMKRKHRITRHCFFRLTMNTVTRSSALLSHAGDTYICFTLTTIRLVEHRLILFGKDSVIRVLHWASCHLDALLTSAFSGLAKCYIWSTALFVANTWTLGK